MNYILLNDTSGMLFSGYLLRHEPAVSEKFVGSSVRFLFLEFKLRLSVTLNLLHLEEIDDICQVIIFMGKDV